MQWNGSSVPIHRRAAGFACAVVPLVVAAAVPVLAAASTPAGEASQNPFTSRADIAEGERLFQKNCVLCHGGDGTGGRGPNLTRGLYRRGNSDQQLFEIIQNGLIEAGMPWLGLSDKNTWQVISYLRTLSGGGDGEVSGDPALGREIFFGSGECSTCHMVNGQGGRQAPDLSWIGWARAPDYLRNAILDPNSDVDPRWWTGVATTADGTRIEGYIVDEDLFTVRLMDAEDNLHALNKAELAGFERKKESAMLPPTLDDDEITNLVAFLAGLRAGVTDR